MNHVRATVFNNVSSLSLPVTVIQVGDNVTSVDVHVADWLVTLTSFHSYADDWLTRMTSVGTRLADWLVPVGEPVKLTMDCPRGWPVILTVDMGDGQPPQLIKRPADYDPSTDDRVPRRRTQATTTPAVPTTTTQTAPGPRRHHHPGCSDHHDPDNAWSSTSPPPRLFRPPRPRQRLVVDAATSKILHRSVNHSN